MATDDDRAPSVTPDTVRRASPAVSIRRWSLDDADELAALYAANREELAESEPWRSEAHFSSAGQHERIGRVLAAEKAREMAFFLISSEGAGLVGTTGIESIARGNAQSGVLGYWVDGRHRRCGIATAAVALVVDHAFAVLGLHRLQANIDVANLASRRVVERNGFERIGIARGLFGEPGAWRDHLLYQRLAAERP